ncbi:hypothetical protein C1J05_10595 [Sulfitobacter sp. JL08]|uniref:flavoprotein n=1 Tax=Sulfitobacter sp. JL08 TaxID=2070369 RepID=UPI000E0A8496|nr:flavoprotein [Sulfitobacter sp. JL08]AXI54883.1 hypothetical protein C1J05_10595 [Sulfitobacter sp. JL08]
MADTQALETESTQVVNDDQWAVVLEALPDAVTLSEPPELRASFNVLNVSEGDILPPTGMFVVLEGSVALLQNDEKLAQAGAGDYFYEAHLAYSELPVGLTAQAQQTTTLACLSRNKWTDLKDETREVFVSTLFGDLVNVYMQDFQQSINCCSVTAAALSMTALGFSCEVNDIFRKVNLPSSYVVNTGIALGELFDIACNYIHTVGLRDRVKVTPFFMDPETTSAETLMEAILESERVAGKDDIIVANFQVGIAHGRPMPGGHFAVIAKCNPSTGLLHMMDVHPEKYGKLWVTTVGRLYAAMSDRDGSSHRARGILRFSARGAVATELKAIKREIRYVDSTIHLNISNDKRHEMFRRSTPNLNGLSVLAESFEIFGDNGASEDKLMQVAELSYTESLSKVRSAAELTKIARLYLAKMEDLHVEAEFRSFNTRTKDSPDTPEAWFEAQLQTLKRPQNQKEKKKRHLQINIDLNQVLGHNAVALPSSEFTETTLLQEFWCLCIAYDETTDYVTLVDMSPATSQVWQIPRTTLFHGLRDNKDLEMVVLQEREKPRDPGDVQRLIDENKLILFYSDDDPWSYMLHSVLNNIGAEDLVEIDVSGDGTLATRMRRQLETMTGKLTVPYLFLERQYLGKRKDIMDSYIAGRLQEDIKKAGLRVLLKTETPSLEHNDYGYPKGGLTDPRDGKRNVLLCACGSSAADKVPELVQKLTDLGHNVKLIPSPHAEHFFKDVKKREERPYDIYDHITPKDVYRDSDEWNFRYTQFDMAVRASHLALCDWADCVVVAPITCNTMGKIAHGIGDTLLTSVFVAWQYQTKPVIFCPACNTNMWNNITTQNNIAILKRLGGTFAGPRRSTLSNGTLGIGAMATPDEIVTALNIAFDDLDHQPDRVIKWAKEAAMSRDPLLWERIFRMIREDVVGVHVLDHETKDTLLHFACGGPGEILGTGTTHGIEHVAAVEELLKFGIDVNSVNVAGYSAMHVAIKNGAEDIIKLILNTGEFKILSCMRMLADSKVELSDETLELLNGWAKNMSHDTLELEVNDEDESLDDDNDTTYLYFTYGSLKRGFPNFEKNAKLLSDFVGVATTTQALPLIVQKTPGCNNPNCGFLHRMATLVDKKGSGKHISGEVYRVTARGLKELDRLEGYDPNNHENNTYVRKTIAVEVEGKTEKAFCYFIVNAAQYEAAVSAGESEIVSEYTQEMAIAIPKTESV